MKKEDEVVEIEEFQIVDVNKLKREQKKYKEIDEKLSKHFKWEELFSKFVNKNSFIVGHALESIKFDLNNNCWYIDTRSYDLVQTGDVLTTYYYRWEFTDPLPEKLLKYIPFRILETAKIAPILVGTDKTFKMPTMGGLVEKVSEVVENNIKEFFVVKNPEIID